MSVVKLKEHNIETYTKIVTLFKIYKRVAVVLPTGAGKSFLIAKLIEDNLRKRICILSPSKEINSQFDQTFPSLMEGVDFLTYSKVIHIKEEGVKPFKYDIIILDEFHRLGAKQWGQGVDRILKNNPNALIFGTTATHIRFLEGGRDMLEELFNGVCANNMSLSTAIESNILPKPKFVTALYNIGIDVEKIKNKIMSSGNSETEKERLSRSLNQAFKEHNERYGVDNILHKHITDERKILVFCENIRHLEEMKSQVANWIKKSFNEDVYIYELHSKNDRSHINLEQFKISTSKGFHLLFSVNKLNEGVHIEGVNCAIFLRNTASPIIFYQQMGRVLTSNSNKSPLIFDLVNNSSNMMICSCGEKGKVGTDRKINIKERESLLFEVFDETKDILNLMDEIEETLYSPWDEMYSNLVEFYKQHGHCIAGSFNSALNKWTIRQRNEAKYLSSDRVEKLNSIGFCWNVLDFKWTEKYNELVKFKETHGHVVVTRGHGDEALYEWVKSQRWHKKNNTLIERRIKLLDELGMKWIYQEEMNNDRWEIMFNELIKFKEINGHVDVPRRSKDTKLANWVITQRKAKKKNTILEDRERRLNEVGFSWILPFTRKKEGN